MNSIIRMTRMSQIKAIVLLTFIQVSSTVDGKDNCTEPRLVPDTFDLPESCAKLNFTSKCNSIAMIRACQDDHTNSCHITKSILCDNRSRHETTAYCPPGETLIINNTFFVCKKSGEPAKVGYPECGVRECGDFGDVANGTYVLEIVRVAKYEYASRVKVQCNEGFVLHGWPVIDCTDNLTWSKYKPQCIPVKCGRLPGQTSPCLQEIKLDKYRGVIRAEFTCLDGNDFNLLVTSINRKPVSTITSYCEYTSGTWSWTHDIGCYCNCFVPADFSKVNASDLVNGTFLKHGKELSWDCVDGYRKTNNRTFKCEDKGLISIEYQSTESVDLVCTDTQAEFLQCVKFESFTITEIVETIIIENSIPWYTYVLIGMLVVVVLIGMAPFIFICMCIGMITGIWHDPVEKHPKQS